MEVRDKAPSPCRWGGLLTFAFCLLPLAVTRAETSIVQPQATAAFRNEQRQQEVARVQPENYDLSRYPVTDSNESYWRNQLWTTAVVEPMEDYVDSALRAILSLTVSTGLSESQTRTVQMAMQVGTQLYLSNSAIYAGVGEQFLQTIKLSSNPQWVAMALSGLAKGGMAPDKLQQQELKVKKRFPDWSQNVFLYTTLQNVTELLTPSSFPPLKDLLNWTVAPNQPHLYVLCSSDGWVLCRAVLKDRNGQFVRQDHELWSVLLLRQSINGLAWNFFRGQTPQGIQRIEGVTPPDEQSFRAYGQFPLVNLFLPFEPGIKEFFPGKKIDSLEAYRTLLPPSWRNYFPIQQSYWAGKIGRSLLRIHGSGEATNFFGGKERHPDSTNWNPSIGCLSALELYDQFGALQQADMPKILNALSTAAGSENFSGYMILIEVPSAQTQTISIADIEALIGTR